MKYFLILLLFSSCALRGTKKTVNDEKELLELEIGQTIEELEQQDLTDLDRIELEQKQSDYKEQPNLEVPPLEPEVTNFDIVPQVKAQVEDLNKAQYKSDALIIYTPLWKKIPIRRCKKIVQNPLYVNGACVERY